MPWPYAVALRQGCVLGPCALALAACEDPVEHCSVTLSEAESCHEQEPQLLAVEMRETIDVRHLAREEARRAAGRAPGCYANHYASISRLL